MPSDNPELERSGRRREREDVPEDPSVLSSLAMVPLAEEPQGTEAAEDVSGSGPVPGEGRDRGSGRHRAIPTTLETALLELPSVGRAAPPRGSDAKKATAGPGAWDRSRTGPLPTSPPLGLAICPVCRGRDTIVARGRGLECRSCGYEFVGAGLGRSPPSLLSDLLPEKAERTDPTAGHPPRASASGSRSEPPSRPDDPGPLAGLPIARTPPGGGAH